MHEINLGVVVCDILVDVLAPVNSIVYSSGELIHCKTLTVHADCFAEVCTLTSIYLYPIGRLNE